MNATTSTATNLRRFPHLFNAKHTDYVNDPYRYYAEVREQSPIYKTPYGIYILTKYKDIECALRSKQLIKNYWKPLREIYGESCYQESGFALISKWLINKNPPEHTQIRRLLTLALSAKNINYLHETTEKIANQLINGFIKNQSVDLVAEYAYKLPALVICQLLGIGPEDHQFLFEKTSLPNVLMDPTYLSHSVRSEANTIVDEIKDYFRVLCKERQKNMGDDLISLLMKARKEENLPLADEDLMSNIFFLFGAGHETTMNLIASGLYSLFLYPDQLLQLKNNYDLMTNAMIEMLRYEAPVQIGSPSFTEEEVNINGFIIPKGEVIIPVLGAACRDPEEYPNPDQFIITRDHKATLAFGYGIHLCLGAQLAKIEGAIAMEWLLKRIPTLRILELDKPKWKPVVSVRSLIELRGEW